MVICAALLICRGASGAFSGGDRTWGSLTQWQTMVLLSIAASLTSFFGAKQEGYDKQALQLFVLISCRRERFLVFDSSLVMACFFLNILWVFFSARGFSKSRGRNSLLLNATTVLDFFLQ